MAEKLAELDKGGALRDWKLGNTHTANAGQYTTINLGIPSDYDAKEVCVFVSDGYSATAIWPINVLPDTITSQFRSSITVFYNPNDARIFYYGLSKSQLQIVRVHNASMTEVGYTVSVYYR